MSFITQTEAEQNATEFANQSDANKARLLAQSEAYLIARNVKPFNDATQVPTALKLASYEIISGILANKLYQGKEQRLLGKTVSAQTGTSVSKTYSDQSDVINAYEQYIADLIQPYAKRQIARPLRRL